MTNNINLPFRLLPAVQEESKNRMTINLKAIANFDETKFASNVIIKFPVSCALGLPRCTRLPNFVLCA